MSYKVIIPTAGLGSRLENLTKNINKSLISIDHKPVLGHQIKKFPKTCEFVIALGFKGQLVKEYLESSSYNQLIFGCYLFCYLI